MGKPAIPPYGKNFRREDVSWDDRQIDEDGYPTMAKRRYVLKKDPEWYIWSDKTSETWMIFHNDNLFTFRATLGEAMQALLTGIEQGFYQVKAGE